jgi:hypothetical protein
LGVQVASASVELQDGPGKMLLQGSMSGVGARMLSYPTATDLRLDITMVGGMGGASGCSNGGLAAARGV